jgi:peptidyl-prolyl cis-trans isomerase D
MATLERIRSKSGLLIGIIGLALFAFIIGDFLTNGSTFFRQAKDKVVVVNGKSFSSSEFQERLDELTTVYKVETGQTTLPEDYVANIRESVYESLVRESIINEQAKKAGIAVSNAELNDLVMGDHISPMIQRMRMFVNPQTGMFDKSVLMNFNKIVNGEGAEKYTAEQQDQINEYKKYWAYVLRTVKNQKLEEKYSVLLSKAVAPNSLEAKTAFEGTQKNVDFLYTMKPYYSIVDSTIEVSDAELKDLYNKRKESFKQNETRSVKYIAVSIAPSKEDLQDAAAKIDAIKQEFATSANVADVVNENSDVQYNDFYVAVRSLPANVKGFATGGAAGAVYGPVLESNVYQMHRIIAKTAASDSVKARHILIPITDEAKSSQTADSVMNALKAGANFEMLSARYSAAQNAKSGGDFGWFNEEAAFRGMGAEFKNACFNTPVNGYAKVKTMYGYDIVQVTAKTAPVMKVKMASIINEVIASKKTNGTIYSKLSQFVISNNTTEKFEANAAKNGYVALANPNVGTNDYNLNEIRNARTVIHWIFNASKGDVSSIFETSNNQLVVAALVDVTDKGFTPFDALKDRLKAEIVADKKGDKIIEDLKTKNATSLEAYASAMGGRIDTAKFVGFSTMQITGIGNEPALCGIAPYTAKGKLTGPIKGKNGVYVFSVINETANNRPFDVKAEINNLKGNYMYRVMYQMMEVLKKEADIEDNRIRFY